MIQQASRIGGMANPHGRHTVSKRFSYLDLAKNNKVSQSTSDTLSSRSRRVPESPDLAEAVINRLANSLDEKEEVVERSSYVKSGSFADNKLQQKLHNANLDKQEEEEPEDDSKTSDDKAKEKMITDALRKVMSFFNLHFNKGGDDDDDSDNEQMDRMIQSELQQMEEVGDRSAADILESFLLDMEESDALNRQKRFANSVEAALDNNHFMSGHYGDPYEETEANDDTMRFERSVDKMSARHRRSVPLTKYHNRNVKHIIHK